MILDYVTIKGFDNYSISNCGTVISNRKKRLPKEMIHRFTKSKYHYVTLINDSEYKNSYIHRLVVETFLGDIPHGYEVNHIDGNKSNNNISNLEIVSHSDNMEHYYGYRVEKPKPKSYLLKCPCGNIIEFKTIQLACRYASQFGASHASLQTYKYSRGFEIILNGDV